MQTLHAGKKYGSCRHHNCTTIATFGPWDDAAKTFSRLLCQAHFQQADPGAEVAGESVDNFISEGQAAQLKNGACLCVGVRADQCLAAVGCLHALHSSPSACVPSIRIELYFVQVPVCVEPDAGLAGSASSGQR